MNSRYLILAFLISGCASTPKPVDALFDCSAPIIGAGFMSCGEVISNKTQRACHKLSEPLFHCGNVK